MKTTLPTLSVLAIALVLASPLPAAPASAPPPPHAAPVSAAPTHEFRSGIALLEAESGEGGWEKLSEDGVAVIRAVPGAEMRYRVRFPEPGFYFVHMRSHYAVGMKNAKGEVMETHSTNDAHLLVGGARLYGSDLTTRPEGMRCHSATLRWWQLPKGPGGHTPEAIKEKPVQAYIPAAGVYEVLLRYRSPGLVIDKLAFTRDGADPADTLAETKASSPPAPTARPQAQFEPEPGTQAWRCEVEAAPAVSQWRLEREHAGFSGDGYLAWRGPHVKHQPGTAILSYGLRVTEPGEYRMSIRTRRDIEGAPRADDQVNDVFVRMDGGPWVKVSHKTPWGQWGEIKHFSFETGLKDAVFSLTSASEYRFEIAARSDNVKIDSIRFVRVAQTTAPATPAPAGKK